MPAQRPLRRQWRHHFQKSYHNPLLNRQTKGGRFKIYFFSGLIVLLVLLYGVLSSAAFALTKLAVWGNHQVSTATLSPLFDQPAGQRVWRLFSQQNFFLFNSRQLTAQLTKQYNFTSVQVKKKFPHTVKITIVEQAPALLLQIGERAYQVDLKGEVFAPASLPPSGALPLVKIKQPTKISLGDHPLTETTREFLLSFNRQLNQIGVTAANFNLEMLTSREIRVTTTENWQIYLNVRQDLLQQVNNLKLVLQTKVKDRQNLQYIDLRFGDRVFYK